MTNSWLDNKGHASVHSMMVWKQTASPTLVENIWLVRNHGEIRQQIQHIFVVIINNSFYYLCDIF